MRVCVCVCVCVCERESEREREMERERGRGRQHREQIAKRNHFFSSYQLTDIDIPFFKI